jgi:hypothetical protein
MKKRFTLQAHHKVGIGLLILGVILLASSLAVPGSYGSGLFIAGVLVLMGGLMVFGFDPFW